MLTLNEIVHEAGRKLQSLQMHTVTGEPDERDLKEVLCDFEALFSIIDPMIEAVGRKACMEFGVSWDKFQHDFKDRLRSSLEGDGLFLIEEAYREECAAKMERVDAVLFPMERV